MNLTVFFLLALYFQQSWACVFKYGNLNGSETEGLEHVLHGGGSSWTYDFAGLDWVGQDGEGNPWSCTSGLWQSPLNVADLQGLPRVPEQARTIFDFGSLTSNGQNIQVINNGHTIQVEWNDPSFKPNASVSLPGTAQGPLSKLPELLGNGVAALYSRIALTPVQFHFHTRSEHMLGGAMYPLELHIVSRVSGIPGCVKPMDCLAVVGVMFQINSNESSKHSLIDDIWHAMPSSGGVTNFLPSGTLLNFSNLLPDDHSYITYAGSLTTPPCSEGILWHVLVKPQTISLSQYEDFMIAVGDYSCNGTALPPVAAVSSGQTARLLQERSHSRMKSQRRSMSTDSSTDKPNDGTCVKLGAGENYRIIQKANFRPLWQYVDASFAAGSPPPPPPPSPTQSPPSITPVVLTGGWKTGPVVLLAVAVGIGSALVTSLAFFAYVRQLNKKVQLQSAQQLQEQSGLLNAATSSSS